MRRQLACTLLTCTLAIVVSSACAARQGLGAETSTSLEQRAAAYWKMREARDLAGAYAFYCAAYRGRVSRDEFIGMTRLVRFGISDVQIASANLSGERAQVTISYRFMMPTISPNPIATETSEWWALEGGDWCKEDEPLALPFPRPGKSPFGS
jgi:hypothetical protein